MQVKASDPLAYYSCDDNFSLVEKPVRSDQVEGHSGDRPLRIDERDNAPCEGISSLEGTC
jgi:hypothetical protein